MTLKLLSMHPTTAMKVAGAQVNAQGLDLAHHTWARMFSAASSACPAIGAVALEAALVDAGLEHELQQLGTARLQAIANAVLQAVTAAPVAGATVESAE